MDRAKECGRRLPNVFTCLDGTPVEDAETWYKKRRPEILGLFCEEEYGCMPDMSDVAVDIRVVDSRCDKNTMDFQAIRNTVEITAVRNGIHFSFTGVVFIPADAAKPVPCFLTICNRGIRDGDPARHFLSPFWPAEMIVSKGYAAAVILTQNIAADYDEGFTTGVHKLFPEYVNNRPDDTWGTLSAWSWGASKMMDYFEQEPLIDAHKVAVVGHSRGGKTAMWTAAQDERFAMAVSSCAGNSGDALARQSHGECIADITGRFPYWFCKNYQRYAGHEEDMPMDQHMLLSLIAPRLLYTTSRTFDKWADPQGQFESLVQAAPVYRLLGKQGITKTEPPKPEHPLHEGCMGYHLTTGNHDMDMYDWIQFLDFADKKLK
ncbi:MAG: prolyl oligopeptidase family serine peptidase [Lachnospiraceae bacterium]|nr:prolyl oligopeptidase family serine peptidase [Lachnospiraceae bacterium]